MWIDDDVIEDNLFARNFHESARPLGLDPRATVELACVQVTFTFGI